MKLTAYVYKFNDKVQRKYIVDKERISQLFKEYETRLVIFGDTKFPINRLDLTEVCAVARSFDIKDDGIIANIDVLNSPNGKLLESLISVGDKSISISCVYLGDRLNEILFPQTIPYLVIGENQFGYRLKETSK